MKPTAIIYTSNTGYTAEYANMLGKIINLPVCTLSEASRKVKKGSPVIYMGWLMAGQVKEYKKAAKAYEICAVCAVGMGSTGSQIDDIRKTNNIPDSTSVFSLQGGFDIKKLNGVYKLMMTTMIKTVGKKLAAKADRTPDEDKMLDLLMNGGSCVSEENLSDVLNWYRSI